MEHETFKKARDFAFNDLKREVALAKASNTKEGIETLRSLGIEPGGGNFMAALALLCYTEFAGKLKNGPDASRKNFILFFDKLGQEYSNFRSSCDVYGIFRCGLAHEYYIKEDCTIYMTEKQGLSGIGREENGKYYFVVERYMQDLKRAFDSLEEDLFGEKA